MRDLTPGKQVYSEHGMSVRNVSVLPGASTDAGAAARYGMGFLVLALGGALLWACLAPLDQGVVGSGTVWWRASARRCSRWWGAWWKNCW